MSKIEVINFEEKVRKMKRSSKVNGFSGMIKMLRHSVDVFEFVGEDVEERLQKYSNLVGKDSKDFMLNPTDMKDSWNSLSGGIQLYLILCQKRSTKKNIICESVIIR